MNELFYKQIASILCRSRMFMINLLLRGTKNFQLSPWPDPDNIHLCCCWWKLRIESDIACSPYVDICMLVLIEMRSVDLAGAITSCKQHVIDSASQPSSLSFNKSHMCWRRGLNFTSRRVLQLPWPTDQRVLVPTHFFSCQPVRLPRLQALDYCAFVSLIVPHVWHNVIFPCSRACPTSSRKTTICSWESQTFEK